MIAVNTKLLTNTGAPYQAMEQVIALRARELGETTRDSAVAMMITWLRSLKAATKVAKLGRYRGKCSEMSGHYFPSYKRVGDKRRLCLRLGSKRGPALDGARVYWRVRYWQTGNEPKVFLCDDTMPGGKDRIFFVVAQTKKEALAFLTQRHKDRIRQYRGLAKWALAYAQGKVSTRSPVATGASQKAIAIGIANTKTRTVEAGGKVSVEVSDAIRYAQQALKGGKAQIDFCAAKACNSVVGYVTNVLGRRGMTTPIKVPFPDVARRR